MPPRKRQADRPKKTPAATKYVPDSRRAWVTVTNEEFVLYVNPEEDDTDSIKVVNVRAQQIWTNDFTRMTLAEFEAVERLYLLAFRLARPLIAERDRKARIDHEAGIGTQHRLYRRPPIAIGVEGDQREYVEGLLFRPPVIPRSLGNGDSPDRGVRGASDDVAPDESSESSPQDDSETPYFS